MTKARIVDETNAEIRTIELKAMPELNEVCTLDDGLMYEVVNINDGVPELKNIQVEEDWGQ